MSTISKTILAGFICSDIEMRQNNICVFSLVTYHEYKDQSGVKQKIPEFHKIVSFGKNAETSIKFLKKGSYIYIEGRIRYEKYTDKNGIDKTSICIRMENFKFLYNPNREPNNYEDSQPHSNDNVSPFANSQPPISPYIPSTYSSNAYADDRDDTIPF